MNQFEPDLSHLNDAAKNIALQDNEQRIKWIKQPRWIGYPRFNEGLKKLQELFEWPQHHRMPNMLIVGHTNNGKTMLIHKFHDAHLRSSHGSEGYATVPIMSVQVPPAPDEGALYTKILDSLFAVYKASESLASKRNKVVNILRNTNTRMLILDEIHHILSGSLDKQRQFLNVIKYLGNELQIPVIAVGTKEALRAIQTDPQLANRFEPFALPRWQPNKEFQKLLASFESILPLRKPSRLYSPNMSKKLCVLSDGLIGELSILLNSLAERAILSGTESITEELLYDVAWVIPSMRKREIEKLLI